MIPYTETQKFRQWWLWLLLLSGAILIPMALIMSLGEERNTLWGVVSVCLIVAIFATLLIGFAVIRLDTRIDETGILYRFYPLRKSTHIPWSEVYQVHVRKYRPIAEYGGWGMRDGFAVRAGGALNISGDMGIQLVLKDKKLLIGTQKAKEVELVLASLSAAGYLVDRSVSN